ncbi:MAG: hypothetical protein GEU75_10575 [Dehalococcoidia bacterium]|nr:hypothetical protein [Dehalococcoidia bacterium]
MFRLFAALSLAAIVGLLGASILNASGGGGGCHQPLTDELATEVTIETSCYSPTVVRVQPGGTVTWTNGDSVPHNILGAGGTWGSSQESSPFLQRGDYFSQAFETAGIFPYYCSYHPGMIGAVAVGEFEVREPTANQAISAASDTSASADRDSDPGGRVLALTGVGIAVALAMVSFGIARSRRGESTPS